MSEANKQVYPRTEADVAAEQKAEAAWGEVGAMAVNPTVELVTPGDTERFAMTDDGVVVTDKRRLTPESAEADYQAKQEELKQPLSKAEALTVTEKSIAAIHEQLGGLYKRESSLTPDEHVALKDLEGDGRAFGRLRQIFSGETIAMGRDSENVFKGLSPKERLADLVGSYAKMTADVPHIGSMGGPVEIDPDTHQVHYDGYNNSILYTFGRAAQILAKLEADPARARTETDTSWLTAEPVIVEPAREAVGQTA